MMSTRNTCRKYEAMRSWWKADFFSRYAVDKSSANHRMFMSLIHEYTKESVKYVPEEKLARKEFVDKIFFNFWVYFPHLDTLHNLGAKISIGKRFYFLKAFVRAGIARGLSSILGRRSTYSQDSLENIDKKLSEMRRNWDARADRDKLKIITPQKPRSSSRGKSPLFLPH